MRPYTNPKVSIIIPCYNLEGYIDTCLNSCMVQTYQNIEILVVNDGSSDGSMEIIDAYSKLDTRIRPIHKHNEGLALARRTGIFEAAGDYLFFLDGDDSIVIDAIEVLLEKAIVSRADLVKGEYSQEADSGYKIQKFESYGTCSPLDFIRLMLKKRLFTVWGILYSRHVFSEEMDYQGNLKRGEDGPLLALVLNRVQRVFLLEKVVYYYRSRPGSITKEVSLANFDDAILARFKIEESVLQAGLDKKRDYELAEFICFSIVLYLRHAHAASGIDQKFIKNKIGEYLINNTPFNVYYREESRKNYLRLKYFYMMRLPHNLFEWAYKLKLLR